MPGWMPIIGLMAYISLNLGIFNLLPIPILDGGMILFLLIETIMRRDVNQQLKERVYQVAFVCILVFAAFVIFNDLTQAQPLHQAQTLSTYQTIAKSISGVASRCFKLRQERAYLAGDPLLFMLVPLLTIRLENSSSDSTLRLSRPQLRHNLPRRLPRLVLPVRRKTDRAHASMATAAISLADRRQIHQLLRRQRRPRIRPHRHLRPEARLAQPHVVRPLGMQIVGDELVVSLRRLVRDVERNHALVHRRPLTGSTPVAAQCRSISGPSSSCTNA